MSDERWIEVDRDMEAAVRHFAGAVRLFADPDLRSEDWEGYKTRMGLIPSLALFPPYTVTTTENP